jgi:hypothetical protein
VTATAVVVKPTARPPVDVRRTAAMVASWGLDGDAADRIARVAPPDDDLAGWHRVCEALERERLTGLASAALADGALVAPASVVERLHRSQTDALAACLALESLLLAVVERFAHHGIDVRVLKGPAIARVVYAEPELRTFGDIDLLVRGTDWDAAAELLVEGGSTARYREPRPGFTARFGKGRCIVAPSGLEVDLHRTFASGPFGLTIDADALMGSGREFRIDEHPTELRCLDPEHMALHACVHAVLGSRVPRLSTLRDVAEIFGARCTVDLTRLLTVAKQWRLEAVVSRAITSTAATLTSTTPLALADWAAAYVPDRFERRALDAYVSSHRSYAAQAVAGVAALPTWRDKAAYSWALLRPSRAYLGEREGGYRRRLARAARTAVGRPSPAPARRDREHG